ncbi:uncharacterized protein LY89DRAFT_723801 [Mollisia scopiformis]|uniref:CFEM domain-containing protein n=1 Tax=Mollisia scopiformis TaxID=149040 RepID=A0A132BC04_MOLSC|nr:uncharacterized protein LY89DRAFT_723801 [Mollisia scopiformis]KUJ09950.1 hypothetical protein LY89DRAFT_723801 [Mollisia scopiformis]
MLSLNLRMIFSRQFLGAAVLVVSLCQTALAEALPQTPACLLNCEVEVLEPMGCPVTNLTTIGNCLCTSSTLQYELAICMFTSCNETDLITATEVLQSEICITFPKESRKAEILRVEVIIAAFAFPMIALRLISRTWVARRLWWDDWMIVICALFMVPNTVIPVYSSYLGFGQHIWDIPVLNFTRLNLLYWVASIFYALIQNFAKLSILFLYLRIFPTPNFRWLVQFALVWQCCHMVAFTFTVIFQCIPVESFWNLTIPGTCMNVNAAMRAGAFASIFEDIAIMVLPISELIGLNLDLRKRLSLCFMFALGSFACVTSMIRLRYVWNYKLTLDGTWNDIEIVLWSDIETYVAVMCSCLMCIRPLLLKIFPALFSTSRAHSAGTESTTSNRRRRTWSMMIGSAFRIPKITNTGSESNIMTRLPDQSGNKSAKTIIIQGTNESERDLQGIEMEERGVSPSTFGRSENEAGVSVESINLHSGDK